MGKKKVDKKIQAIYRQFTRIRFKKYKFQFPRLRESEIVTKIIREWEAMDEEQKEAQGQDFIQRSGYGWLYDAESSPSECPAPAPALPPKKMSDMQMSDMQMSPARPKIRKRNPPSPKVRVFQEKPTKRIGGRKVREDSDIARSDGCFRSGGWKTPEGRSSSSDSEKQKKAKKKQQRQQQQQQYRPLFVDQAMVLQQPRKQQQQKPTKTTPRKDRSVYACLDHTHSHFKPSDATACKKKQKLQALKASRPPAPKTKTEANHETKTKKIQKKKAEIINPTNDVKCKCKKIMITTATLQGMIDFTCLNPECKPAQLDDDAVPTNNNININIATFSSPVYNSMKPVKESNNIAEMIKKTGRTIINKMVIDRPLMRSFSCPTIPAFSLHTQQQILLNCKIQGNLPLRIEDIPGFGFGVVATKKIPAGVIVASYLGVLRRHQVIHHNNRSLFQIGSVAPSPNRPGYALFVEPQKKCNVARFLNHSDEPNCRSELGLIKVGKHVEPRVILITMTQILPNTELTYIYGIDYWTA